MKSELEYHGFWKMPDDKEWKLTGTLKLSSAGIFLKY